MTKTSAWHDEALRAYEFEGLSYQEIADRFERNRSTVIKLINRRNAKRRTPLARKGGRPKSEDVLPISSIHKYIGITMNTHREVELQMSLTEFSALMGGKSALLLRKMELGQHDFTLSELGMLSDVLGKPIEDLINSPKPAIYKEASTDHDRRTP